MQDRENARPGHPVVVSVIHPHPMNAPHFLRLFFAVILLATSALAADATGHWKWQITGPNGEIDTILKLALKDGKLGGMYQNQFGETAIKDVNFKDDVLTFAVDRDFGGNKFTLKFRGKVDGDAIKGEIEVPNFGGDGGTQKMDWNAKRVPGGASPEKK